MTSTHSLLTLLLCFTSPSLTHAATALTNVPPVLASSTDLGYATDNAFNPDIYRDGGGGGFINGYHVFSFSDSFTTTGPINGSLTSFVHNTFSYFGYIDESDPTQMYDFGTTPNAKTGYRHFKGTLAADQVNETNVPHTVISIWPNSNMIELKNGKQGLAVYSIYNASHDSDVFYNTMITIDIEDPANVPEGQTLNATRIVPQLFYGNENLYGSFCTYRSGASGSKHEPSDSHLYLFSTSTSGIKVARVPLAHKTDRSFYQYWTGSTWSATQPSVSDTVSSIIVWDYYFNSTTTPSPSSPTTTTTTYGPYGPGSGDIFWSNWFNSFICIFQSFGVSSDFYLSYSTTQSLVSGWTTPVLIYETPVGADPMCVEWLPDLELDYCGHAYPSWDMSGETVLLSYSACDGWTRMVKVGFEGTAGGAPKASKVKTKISAKTKTQSTHQEMAPTTAGSGATSVNATRKAGTTTHTTSNQVAKSSSTVIASSGTPRFDGSNVFAGNSTIAQSPNDAVHPLARLSRRVLRREVVAVGEMVGEEG